MECQHKHKKTKNKTKMIPEPTCTYNEGDDTILELIDDLVSAGMEDATTVDNLPRDKEVPD
jgi:hypothetical protein